jgi:hypothetical protein
MPKTKLTTEGMLKTLRRSYKRYLKYKGVHYADIGYKYTNNTRTDQLCLRLYVHRKHTKKFLKADAIPKRIEGIKTDIIISNPKLHPRFGDRHDNLRGGIEILNSYLFDSGTLGAILYDANNNLVGLSNHHVLYGGKGQDGDTIIQPKQDVAQPTDIVGNLITGSQKYDCAIFSVNANRNSEEARILELTNKITAVQDPTHGLPVKKSGIASDVTGGIIDGVGVDGSFCIVQNPARPNPNNVLATFGDSGSIWVLDDGLGDVAVGLHYAGEQDGSKAYAYNIRLVTKTLDIHF